jgi:hypothetical protein
MFNGGNRTGVSQLAKALMEAGLCGGADAQ